MDSRAIPYKQTLPKKPDNVNMFLLKDGDIKMGDVTNLYYDDQRARAYYDALGSNQRSDYVKIKLVEKSTVAQARLLSPIETSPSQQICYLSVHIKTGEETNSICAGQFLRFPGTNILFQIHAFLIDSDATLSVFLVNGKSHVSDYSSLSLILSNILNDW